MKIEDIKVGMKVVPFQKLTGGTWGQFIKSDTSSSCFFRNNGYLMVENVAFSETIGPIVTLCGGERGGFDRWNFRPCDLKPYEEPKGMRLEDIKVGMKVVPFNKTSRSWISWEGFMQEATDCTKYFKEHGYLLVTEVDKGRNETWLNYEPNSHGGGSCFGLDDITPYEEPAPKANSVEDWDIILGKFGAISIIETAKVIRNGPATIVILPDGFKGVAKCNPADEYNAVFGFEWAYVRAKEAQLRKGGQ